MSALQVWEDDPALYVFTSLTAGSSHIVTATSRIETILRANRIPFSYIDTATNDSAKMLYQRRGKGKKLPFLVKEGFVIGDLEQVEEWNEFGELKEAIGPVATKSTSITTTPAKTPAPSSSKSAVSSTEPSTPAPGSKAPAAKENQTPSMPLALRQAAFETASAAKEKKAAASKPAPLSAAAIAPLTSSDSSTPLSPSKVPLPATPSAAAAGPLKSPRGSMSSPPPSGAASPRHRHTSSNSSLSKQFVPEHYEPAATSHRGSSVSLASEEEIREIENSQTIMEENEDEDEDEVAEEEKPIIIPTKKASDDAKADEKKEGASADESGKGKSEGTSAEKSDGAKPKVLEKVLEKAHIKHGDSPKEE